MESLPDHVVLEILIRLPARDIHRSAMYVCWKWYNMTRSCDFIYSHLQQSPSVCLITNGYSELIFAAMRDGRLKMFLLNYELDSKDWPCGSSSRVWASCNGLVLSFNIRSYHLFIANPVTHWRLTLPRLLRVRNLSYINSCLSYLAASMDYKVAFVYDSGAGSDCRCAILTVQTDKTWRHVHTGHLSQRDRACFRADPLVTGSFVHWPNWTHTLTLNVETETIQQIPILEVHGNRVKKFLAMGNNLSFVMESGEFSWEIWEMTPEAGSWKHFLNIYLGAKKWMVEFLLNTRQKFSLTPVCWLKPREELLFHVSSTSISCVAYNVLTHKIRTSQILWYRGSKYFVEHVNSLVRLDRR